MSTICADAVLKVADPEKNHLDLKDIQVISKGTGLNIFVFFFEILLLPLIRLKFCGHQFSLAQLRIRAQFLNQNNITDFQTKK